MAAAVLADGDWWLEQSSRERIADAGLGTRAADRVSVREVPDLRQSGVRVTVTLATGAELVRRRDDGTAAAPMIELLGRAA